VRVDVATAVVSAEIGQEACAYVSFIGHSDAGAALEHEVAVSSLGGPAVTE
jgi:hypothetical protein